MNSPHIEEIKKVIKAFGHQVSNCGIPASKVEIAQQKLQMKLPQILVDFYVELGNHPIYHNRGCYEYNLVAPDKIPSDGTSLILFSEGGGYDSIWEQLPIAELNKPEPVSEFWMVDAMVFNRSLLTCLQTTTLKNLSSHHYANANYHKVDSFQPFVEHLPEIVPKELYIMPELYVLVSTKDNGDIYLYISAVNAQGLLDFISQPGFDKFDNNLHGLELHIQKDEAINLELLEHFMGKPSNRLYYDDRQVSFEELKKLN